MIKFIKDAKILIYIFLSFIILSLIAIKIDDLFLKEARIKKMLYIGGA